MFGQTSQAPAFGAQGFNTATPASTSFGFGTGVSTAPGSGFGAGTNLQPGFQFGAASKAPPTMFGTTFTPAATAPAVGFGIGSATSVPSLFGGTTGFGLVSSAAPTSFTGLTTNVITTMTAGPSLGLGGINSTPFGGESTTTSTQGKADSKALKEMAVPNEVVQTVEDFKKYVKEQKAMKEEVACYSAQPLEKLGEEVEVLKNLLANLANNIQQQSALVQKLKHDFSLETQNAEIAMRTKETAPSLQVDNTAPIEYFFRLAADFEQRMQYYKQQIEDTERNLLAVNRQQSLTPQELMATMKKLHEAFVSLCGRVHTVHSSLQNYKQEFLANRRRITGDTLDIFANKSSPSNTFSSTASTCKVASGPAPFGGTSDYLPRNLPQVPVQMGGDARNASGFGFTSFGGSQLPSLLNNSSSNTTFATPGRSTGFFGNTSQTLLPTENRSFQLQSPPAGNKRNKR